MNSDALNVLATSSAAAIEGRVAARRDPGRREPVVEQVAGHEQHVDCRGTRAARTDSRSASPRSGKPPSARKASRAEQRGRRAEAEQRRCRETRARYAMRGVSSIGTRAARPGACADSANAARGSASSALDHRREAMGIHHVVGVVVLQDTRRAPAARRGGGSGTGRGCVRSTADADPWSRAARSLDDVDGPSRDGRRR